MKKTCNIEVVVDFEVCVIVTSICQRSDGRTYD